MRNAKMYKYQNEFLKFVNEKVGKKIFRRGDWFEFLFCVPESDKEYFILQFAELKGWTEEETKEKLF